MASTINASNSGSGGLISTGDATGALALQTAGTTAVTIDTSQNVGINLTPASQFSTVRGLGLVGTNGNASYITSGGSQDLVLTSNAYLNTSGNFTYVNTDSVVQQRMTSGIVSWFTAASGTAGTTATLTERMRIDSSGNLLVGQTAQFGSGKTCVEFNGQSFVGASYRTTYSTSSGSGYINFRYSDNSQVGAITLNGTTGVTYGTTSDYRLKDNVQPMTGALNKVAQLKPVKYKWKSDGSDGQGFIAHELQAVVPDCVTGEKDEVDADGNPVYQGIDTSFLVATLTAAIQELKAINDTQAETINALTARVVALEGK